MSLLESWISYIILAYYISILIEIMWIPVPSVASTWQLMFPDNDLQAKLDRDSLIWRTQNFNWFKKMILVILPYVIAFLGYTFPLLWLLFPPLSKWDISSMNDWNIIVGVVLMVMGRLVTIGSALGIRKDNSQKGVDFDLKTEGIFARSRNPIVVGLHLGIIGLNILIPNYLFIIFTCFYFGNIHFKILIEEDFLSQFFQGDYNAYLKKTKRYL